MNANPFTKGHLHLSEYASKKVDKLIVFVVEEDKSFFPFKDRFKLVKKGLAHLKNVVVVKSGNFIISQQTFPDYFSKETNIDMQVDTTKDLRIFGDIIAKELGIKTRFVGQEPKDMVTKQYNEQMKKILPKFGVKLVEIPRIAIDEVVISASSVRAMMKEKQYEKLKQIVPKSTYKYIKALKPKEQDETSHSSSRSR